MPRLDVGFNAEGAKIGHKGHGGGAALAAISIARMEECDAIYVGRCGWL